MKSQILKTKKQVKAAAGKKHAKVANNKKLVKKLQRSGSIATKSNKVAADHGQTKHAKATIPRKKVENNISDSKKIQRTPSAAPILEQSEVKRAISQIVEDQEISDYLKKNVSKNSIDVISMLTTPKTDEYISEELGLKINAVRRILNIMQGYGLTNYYVAKNTNGWLSFAWYINPDKVESFAKQITAKNENSVIVDENCNDYFICKKCYESDKLVFTFDAAFEVNFKCQCGKSLTALDKDSVKSLLKG
ncbi:MAG: hypothetical protein QXN59_01800 [Candidatus Micrarchaeaceae archaeon]